MSIEEDVVTQAPVTEAGRVEKPLDRSITKADIRAVREASGLVAGDLDEKGIANLRKVFPRAIARIEQEAATLERRRTVERVNLARRTLAGLSLPLGSTRSAVEHERDAALAILDALASESDR